MFTGSYLRVVLALIQRISFVLAVAGLVLPALPKGAYADPPPWAPAYGHRHKHKDHHDEDEDEDSDHDEDENHHEHREKYVVPYDIDRGTCNRELLGQVLGGAAGAAVGSTIGKGTGKTAAIVGGAIIGVLIGGKIGRQMDEIDHNCMGQILEHAEDGRRIAWSDSTNGVQYQVVPTRTFKDSDGHYCRKFSTDIFYGDQKQRVYGTACRQPDGAWRATH